MTVDEKRRLLRQFCDGFSCECYDCPLHSIGDCLKSTWENKPEDTIEKCYTHVFGSEQAVNHPEHYQGKHECIEVMRAMFGDEAVAGFCRCNSFKYRFRAGNKDGNTYEQDIAKAEWYENYLIEMLKGGEIGSGN